MGTQRPYTEQRHPASEAIDTASPKEIVSLMLKEDDIFTGWDESLGVFNEAILQTMVRIQDVASDLLQDCDNNAIVLAGCGTSGRFAFMTARTMNDQLEKIGKRPCFEYLMAGNDIALFTSQEGYEDDPVLGQEVLEKVTAGRRRVLYVGITCSLSAPFIAGQLDWCMQHPDKFVPVLLGFNPVSAARTVPIEKWGKTFYEVAEKMLREERKGHALILNPIIGPELITGSSRMKAGTCTKMLLDTIFTTRQETAAPAKPETFILSLLETYRKCLYAVHTMENDDEIAQIVEMAAFSLENDGHVYYLGDEDLGLVGMIDASECFPTFGTATDDVRGFVNGGYKALRNKDGDMSEKHQVCVEYFRSSILPTTTKSDLVVVLTRDGDLGFAPDLRASACRAVLINIRTSTQDKNLKDADHNSYEALLEINLEMCGDALEGNIGVDMQWSLVEVAAKWVCNTLTTGAHILIGKVYKNFMVDVNVSNSKLFHRAIGIVEELAGCDNAQARNLLLRAIYQTDDLSPHVLQLTVSKHLEAASKRSKIVPLALVLGLCSCTVTEAAGYLLQNPVVRHVIAQKQK